MTFTTALYNHLTAALLACAPDPDEWPDVLAYVEETTKHLEPQDTE